MSELRRSSPLNRWGGCLLCVLVLAAMGRAQESMESRFEALKREYEARLQAIEARYTGRITSLENEVENLRSGEAELALENAINGAVNRVQRQGLTTMGQATVLDGIYNPAMFVVGDFIASGSDQRDGFGQTNGFLLRSIEFGFRGMVDPYVSYWVHFHATQDEFELEEAFAVLQDGLPDTFQLRAGRMNLDFGKLSRIHEHDLPFVDKPGVLQEFLGGSLRGTGIELNHWFPASDNDLVRWSVALVNALDGDAHPVFGPLAGHHHHHGEEEVFGERSIENLAINARLTALIEIGDRGTLQIGGSLAWAPKDRRFHAHEEEHGAEGVEEEHGEAFDLRRLIAGIDVEYRAINPITGEGPILGAEVLFSRQEILEEEEGAEPEILDRDAWGFYAYGTYSFGRKSAGTSWWTVGASGGWHEATGHEPGSSWDAGAFVTWQIDEFNRLRLEARYYDLAEDDFFAVMLQWTVVLGSHGHPIPW